MYAKGSGKTKQDLEWHLVINLFGGDNTVEVACGYPEMPDMPRHSGRFQPQAMASHPVSPICEKCETPPKAES